MRIGYGPIQLQIRSFGISQHTKLFWTARQETFCVLFYMQVDIMYLYQFLFIRHTDLQIAVFLFPCQCKFFLNVNYKIFFCLCTGLNFPSLIELCKVSKLQYAYFYMETIDLLLFFETLLIYLSWYFTNSREYSENKGRARRRILTFDYDTIYPHLMVRPDHISWSHKTFMSLMSDIAIKSLSGLITMS